ncbi:MAG: hypothetical protein NTW87_31265, partial [Planctomycetota bacterium]|nr:hypothetical protein [Planctomycetota bacterium]
MPWRNAAAIAALVFLSAPRILLAAEPDQPAPFRWRKVTEVADAERVFPSAVDPNTVFVWSRGGLLVSKDDGHTFAARDKGLVQQLGAVTALLVNPIRPATLYAGTLAKGIFTSDDEGAAWRALGGVDQGLAGNRIHALVFSQDDPTFTTMFASHSMQQPGISMTIDGGKTWRVFAREYGVN